MTIKKVYEGLDRVERGVPYHLGYYEVDFADGALTFQLHAQICGEAHCPCDNLQIDWVTDGRTFHTWFTAEREWQDAEHKPLPDELTDTFRIVEDLETFQERYTHLVYLRRLQVLREADRLQEPFEVRMPRDLVTAEGDPEKQTLGKVRPGAKGGRALPYAIEFCGDQDCYCSKLFVTVLQPERHHSFCVEPDNSWSAVEDHPEAYHLLARVEPRLMREESFRKQLGYLRGERILQNYHRFVTRYAREHKRELA